MAQQRHVDMPWWRLVAASAISLGMAACAQPAPVVVSFDRSAQQNQQTTPDQAQAQIAAPTPAPPVAVANPTSVPAPGVRTTSVRLGSIADVLLLNGRVAGVDETPLTFTTSGTVANVQVQPGQNVKQGQVLIDLDAKQLQKDLAAAQSKAQAAAESLQKGQDSNVRAQLQANDRRDSAVADAQARLRQAQSNLSKVRAGASDSDKQAADGAVLVAQNNLDTTSAELSKLSAPPDVSTMRTAQQQVASAQIALQAVQADQAKLTNGPDASALRDAERALADAKTGLSAAQTNLDKLTRGPDQFDVRAAQRTVDAAQANLDAITSGNDTKVANDTRTQAQKDAAVTQAKLALQDAQDKLARLKQPPDPVTVQLAQSKVDDAKAAIAAAQDKLDTLHKPPDQLSLDKAQSAVNSAQTTFDNARAALSQLQSGPPADQVRATTAAVDGAKVGLKSAQSRRDEVYGHPTSAEVQDAQDVVGAAQQALDKIQNGSTASDSGAADLTALQRGADEANAQVKEAQTAVDATHLQTPSDAVVAQVLVQSGDTVDPSKPVMVLSQSSEPVVRVNLLDGDKPKRVAVGQKARLQLDGSDGQFDGEVAGFAPPASNGDRIALVKVDWGTARPTIGTGARASITIRQKDNALIVPLRAIKTAGSKRYIETLNGSTRKSNPVELGIVSGTDVEILSGVQEGQNVLLDSPIDTGQVNGLSTGARPTVAPSAVETPAAPSAVPTALPPSSGENVASRSEPGNLPAAAASVLDLTGVPLAPVSSATPHAGVVDEWFTDNRRNWPSDPQGPAWLAGGAYHLATRQAGHFVAIAIPGAEHLGDASITGSFRKTGGQPGGGYGLIVRNQDSNLLDGVNQNGHFYDFEVGDRGEFGVWLRDNDRWVDVVPWSQSSAVKPGVGPANDLAVTLVGDRLSFKVNDVEMTSQVDDQLHVGSAGVFVGGDGTQVELYHLTVNSSR